MIFLQNASTVLSPADEAKILVPMAAAVQTQLARDVAPVWSMHPWRVQYVPAGAAPNFKPDRADYWNVIATIVDSDPSVAGALAFHESVNGLPDIKVLAATILSQPGASWLTGAASVSVGFSHEAIETLLDYLCIYSASKSDGSANYALEGADPVENNAYEINGVSVSDFVHPQWFDDSDTSSTPRDQLGVVSSAFQIAAGGYAVVTPQGQPTQVQNERGEVVDPPADHGSRAQRRGVVLPDGHPFKVAA